MPFTVQQMKAYLDSINGDNGIVSSIGKIPHTRGDINVKSRSCAAFDTLTKILFKGPEPTVYVAIIHNITTNEIHISYPGKPLDPQRPNIIPRALDQDMVNELLEVLRNVISNPTIEMKTQLFQEMYNKGNDLLIQQLINKQEEEKHKLKARQPNDFKLLQKMLQRDILPQTLEEILSNGKAQEIASSLIDKILSNVQELAITLGQLGEQQIIVVPYAYDQTHSYHGVHVEVKGIHFAKIQSDDSTKFNIGLARRDNGTPGCCAGCSSEFDALSEAKQHIINRSADFSYNFPPKNYQVSQNVTNDPDIFTSFIKILHAKCNAMIQDSAYMHLGDHAFFNQAIEILGESRE